MGFFKVNRPRQFNYTPRYYDPEKEARAQRRKELLGEDPLADAPQGEYKPGQYIRHSVAARRGSIVTRKHERKPGGGRVLIFVLLLVLFGAVLYLW